MKPGDVAKIIEEAMRGDKAAFVAAVQRMANAEKEAGNPSNFRWLTAALRTPQTLKAMEWIPPANLTKHATLLDCPSEPPPLYLEKSTTDAIDAVLDEHQYTAELAEAGLKPVSRILLSGPPGTGKTSTAVYLAHKLGKSVALAPAHKIVQSHLGESGQNIAGLFAALRGFGGVLFLDEIDGLGLGRSGEGSGASVENSRITNALLTSLESDIGDTVVVAATNRRDLLDPALVRRFDAVIEYHQPSADTVQRVIAAVGKDLPADLARRMERDALMSGWSHATLVNELLRARKAQVLAAARKGA
jgi:SpoVK/Ycf46/Vps4 family AAA+-type ATPase